MNLIKTLYQYQPKWEWKSEIAVIIVTGILLLIAHRKKKCFQWRQKQSVAFILLGMYLLLVFMSTVFTRKETIEIKYKLELFWSYRDALGGDQVLLKEILMNCVLLLPYGALMPVILNGKSDNDFYYGKYIRFSCFEFTFITGILISTIIEFLQLILKRGTFEWDDIMNNAISVVMGYILYRGAKILKSIMGK